MVSYAGTTRTLIALPSAAYTATVPSSCTVATNALTNLALDITLTSFTGGTTPTITFILERQGADGVWYQICTTGALNAAQTVSVDLSPSSAGTTAAPLTSTSQHAVLTNSLRLRWTLGGGVAPTAVTFSASVVGSC